MNFNIDLADIGGLPVANLLIVGCFILISLVIYRAKDLYEIYKDWHSKK